MGRHPYPVREVAESKTNVREGSAMTLAELRNSLADLETAGEIGPETPVFVDHPARGLQDPVLYTSEKLTNGAHVIIIEAPKDTIEEVS